MEHSVKLEPTMISLFRPSCVSKSAVCLCLLFECFSSGKAIRLIVPKAVNSLVHLSGYGLRAFLILRLATVKARTAGSTPGLAQTTTEGKVDIHCSLPFVVSDRLEEMALFLQQPSKLRDVSISLPLLWSTVWMKYGSLFPQD